MVGRRRKRRRQVRKSGKASTSSKSKEEKDDKVSTSESELSLEYEDGSSSTKRKFADDGDNAEEPSKKVFVQETPICSVEILNELKEDDDHLNINEDEEPCNIEKDLDIKSDDCIHDDEGGTCSPDSKEKSNSPNGEEIHAFERESKTPICSVQTLKELKEDDDHLNINENEEPCNIEKNLDNKSDDCIHDDESEICSPDSKERSKSPNGEKVHALERESKTPVCSVQTLKELKDDDDDDHLKITEDEEPCNVEKDLDIKSDDCILDDEGEICSPDSMERSKPPNGDKVHAFERESKTPVCSEQTLKELKDDDDHLKITEDEEPCNIEKDLDIKSDDCIHDDEGETCSLDSMERSKPPNGDKVHAVERESKIFSHEKECDVDNSIKEMNKSCQSGSSDEMIPSNIEEHVNNSENYFKMKDKLSDLKSSSNCFKDSIKDNEVGPSLDGSKKDSMFIDGFQKSLTEKCNTAVSETGVISQIKSVCVSNKDIFDTESKEIAMESVVSNDKIEGISDELDQLDSKKAVSELYDSNNDNDSKIVLSIKEIEVGMESTTDSVNTEKISDESDNKKGAIFNAEKESDNILISMKKDLVDNDKKEEVPSQSIKEDVCCNKSREVLKTENSSDAENVTHQTGDNGRLIEDENKREDSETSRESAVTNKKSQGKPKLYSNESQTEEILPDCTSASGTISKESSAHLMLEPSKRENLHESESAIEEIKDRTFKAADVTLQNTPDQAKHFQPKEGNKALIPGRSFIIGVRSSEDGKKIYTFDCVLCFNLTLDTCFSGVALNRHVKSKEHALNVMEVEAYHLYTEYKNKDDATVEEVFSAILKFETMELRQNLVLATPKNYSSKKEAIKKKINYMKQNNLKKGHSCTSKSKLTGIKKINESPSKLDVTTKENTKSYDSIERINKDLIEETENEESITSNTIYYTKLNSNESSMDINDESENVQENSTLEQLRRIDEVVEGGLLKDQVALIRVLMKKQKKRKPTNIVIVMEMRDVVLDTRKLPENTKILSKLDSNFSNVYDHIKSDQFFDKGTVFVFMCGLFSGLQKRKYYQCIQHRCSIPVEVLEVDIQKNGMSLVDEALTLHKRILEDTTNDQVLFCDIMPVHIDDYNIFKLDNRMCSHNHPIELYRKTSLSELHLYYESLRTFDAFVKFHTKSLGYETFDILKNTFMLNVYDPESNKINYRSDGLTLSTEYFTRRASHILEKIENLLKIIDPDSFVKHFIKSLEEDQEKTQDEDIKESISREEGTKLESEDSLVKVDNYCTPEVCTSKSQHDVIKIEDNNVLQACKSESLDVLMKAEDNFTPKDIKSESEGSFSKTNQSSALKDEKSESESLLMKMEVNLATENDHSESVDILVKMDDNSVPEITCFESGQEIGDKNKDENIRVTPRFNKIVIIADKLYKDKLIQYASEKVDIYADKEIKMDEIIKLIEQLKPEKPVNTLWLILFGSFSVFKTDISYSCVTKSTDSQCLFPNPLSQLMLDEDIVGTEKINEFIESIKNSIVSFHTEVQHKIFHGSACFIVPPFPLSVAYINDNLSHDEIHSFASEGNIHIVNKDDLEKIKNLFSNLITVIISLSMKELINAKFPTGALITYKNSISTSHTHVIECKKDAEIGENFKKWEQFICSTISEFLALKDDEKSTANDIEIEDPENKLSFISDIANERTICIGNKDIMKKFPVPKSETISFWTIEFPVDFSDIQQKIMSIKLWPKKTILFILLADISILTQETVDNNCVQLKCDNPLYIKSFGNESIKDLIENRLKNINDLIFKIENFSSTFKVCLAPVTAGYCIWKENYTENDHEFLHKLVLHEMQPYILEGSKVQWEKVAIDFKRGWEKILRPKLIDINPKIKAIIQKYLITPISLLKWMKDGVLPLSSKSDIDSVTKFYANLISSFNSLSADETKNESFTSVKKNLKTQTCEETRKSKFSPLKTKSSSEKASEVNNSKSKVIDKSNDHTIPVIKRGPVTYKNVKDNINTPFSSSPVNMSDSLVNNVSLQQTQCNYENYGSFTMNPQLQMYMDPSFYSYQQFQPQTSYQGYETSYQNPYMPSFSGTPQMSNMGPSNYESPPVSYNNAFGQNTTANTVSSYNVSIPFPPPAVPPNVYTTSNNPQILTSNDSAGNTINMYNNFMPNIPDLSIPPPNISNTSVVNTSEEALMQVVNTVIEPNQSKNSTSPNSSKYSSDTENDVNENSKILVRFVSELTGKKQCNTPFKQVFIIGSEEFLKSLGEKKIPNVTFIYHNLSDNEDQLWPLLKKMGSLPSNGVCMLAFGLSFITELTPSPGCKAYKCKQQIYTHKLSRDSGKKKKNAAITEKISSVISFCSKLSLYIPVIILPLYPSKIYCDYCISSNSSTQNKQRHFVTHVIPSNNTYIIQKSSTEWKSYCELILKTWNSYVKVHHDKDKNLKCIPKYPFLKNTFAIKDVSEFYKDHLEPKLWNRIVNAILQKVFTTDNYESLRVLSKPEENIFSSNDHNTQIKLTLKIVNLKTLSIKNFVVKVLRTIDSNIGIEEFEEHVTVKFWKGKIISIYHQLNKYRVGDCVLTATVIEEGERIPEEKVNEEHKYFASIRDQIYLEFKQGIIEDMKKKLNRLVDVTNYKTKPCKRQGCEDGMNCSFYHGKNDRRRNPCHYKYTSKMCSLMMNSSSLCRKADKCPFAHNIYEQLYHPKEYQTDICTFHGPGKSIKRDASCKFAHKDSPETFFTKHWTDSIVFQSEETIRFLKGAVKAILKFEIINFVKICVMSPSLEFLDVCSRVIEEDLKEQNISSIILDNNKFINPSQYHVFFGTPYSIANFHKGILSVGSFGALIVDNVNEVLSNDLHKSCFTKFLSKLKTRGGTVSNLINKIFVTSQYDSSLAIQVSSLVGVTVREVITPEPSPLFINVLEDKCESAPNHLKDDASTSTDRIGISSTKWRDVGALSREESTKASWWGKVSHSRSPSPPSRSKDRPKESSSSKRSRSKSKGKSSMDSESSYSRRNRSRSRDRRKSSRRRSRSRSPRSSTSRRRSISPPKTSSHEPSRSSEQLQILKKELGGVYEEFLEEERKLSKAHDDEYKIYEQVPDMHPKFLSFYEEFLSSYRRRHGSSQSKEHKDRYWKIYWDIRIHSLKNSEWTEKRTKLEEKYKEKATAAKKEEKFSLEGTVTLLEKLSDRLGVLGPALMAIINSAKKNGLTTERGLSVFRDEETNVLIQMIKDKLLTMHKSDPSPELNKAAGWIDKLIEFVNKEDVSKGINLKAIAKASMGKDPSFTVNLIKTALAYEGINTLSREEINELYLKVCGMHFEMSVSDI